MALGFREMTIYKLLPGSLIQNASVDTRLVHYVKLIHRFLAIEYARMFADDTCANVTFFLGSNSMKDIVIDTLHC